MDATVTRRDQSASPGAGAARLLARRVAEGPSLLLDGATGTELERRGLPCALPLWSARALLDDPALLARIHRAYVAAGAEIVTADTFRTHRRSLAAAGLAARAAELTALAVRLARAAAGQAAGSRPCWIAGSIAPLEDCYRPDLVPDDEALAREHAAQAEALAAAGADLLLVETMNTVREAHAATRAAAATGLPVWTSFVCDGAGRLLSGEPLAAALDAVAASDPLLVGVNCLPADAVDAALPVLRAAGRPFGVYANLGAPDAAGRFRTSGPNAPDAFAERARGWLAAGARAVGGCCGTTPAHIAALARVLHAAAPPDRDGR